MAIEKLIIFIKKIMKSILGLIKGLSILRRLFTNNYNSEYLAIGECHHYFFPEKYIKLDYKNSDFNIDLNNFKKLPFDDNSFKCITLYHILEHINQLNGEKLLSECNRILKKNGGLRLELPDYDLFINAFNSNNHFFLNYFKKNRTILVNNYGFDKKILEDHITVVGEMASYVCKSIHGIHIPVYCTKEEFFNSSSRGLEEMNKLAQSKMTYDQKQSFGHNNSFNYKKINNMLKDAGFTIVHKMKRNQTNIESLKLGRGVDNLSYRINEKKHREFFSMYIDAIK